MHKLLQCIHNKDKHVTLKVYSQQGKGLQLPGMRSYFKSLPVLEINWQLLNKE